MWISIQPARQNTKSFDTCRQSSHVAYATDFIPIPFLGTSRESMMKPSSLLLILSMLALVLAGPTACKKNQEKQQEQRLLGAWVIDNDATVAQMPEDQQQMAGAFIKMMKIGLIFNDDETLLMRVSMMGQKDEQEATYKILDADEDTLTIELDREETVNEEGEVVEGEPSKMVVTFLSDDSISFKSVAEEGETQEEVDAETIILKRTTEEDLEADLEDSGQPSLEDLGIDPSELGGPEGQDPNAAPEGLEQVDPDAEADADADAEDADAEDADADAEDADADAEEGDDADAEEDAAE